MQVNDFAFSNVDKLRYLRNEEVAVDILTIFLFILGVGFLFLGCRWQNPPNEEALSALKGLACLKRETIRLEDQVRNLESKLLELKEINFQQTEPCRIEHKEMETKKCTTKRQEFGQVLNPLKCSLYLLNTKDKSERNPKGEASPSLSPKYQEVLKLAANGQCIPEIAQRLVLSQDAVRMVLRMQSDGGNNR